MRDADSLQPDGIPPDPDDASARKNAGDGAPTDDSPTASWRATGALAEIVEHKRSEVEAAKVRVPLDVLKERISELGRPRNFFQAVVRHQGATDTAVIAEIKRKSPSAGWIRPEYEAEGFDPSVIARRYHSAGAAAISCLTDEKFFGGHLSYIHRVRDAVPLPVLRKDFIVDPYQVWESRANGADAILLIAECLSQSEMVDLMILARELQLTTLVEVHSMENLLRVRPHVGFPDRSYGLLGINNRDLSAMKTDIAHTLRLIDLVDDVSILVSESGIRTPEDLKRLRKVGVRIALVGEHLMREEDPGGALKRLLG
jgi:indole-3-glycerol phosphate synthase